MPLGLLKMPPAASPVRQNGPKDGIATINANWTQPDLTSGDGHCSLSKAIINANTASRQYTDCTAGAPLTTIALNSNKFYTVTNSYMTTYGGPTGLPPITSTITISGNGSTVLRQADPATPFRLLAVGPGEPDPE